MAGHHRTTRTGKDPNWYTLPQSPSHSSSDFEFTISISPRKSSTADDLFYNGQLLPLHPSTTATSNDSTSRPSSATEEEEEEEEEEEDFKRLHNLNTQVKKKTTTTNNNNNNYNNYFSFSTFSSVFSKDNQTKTRDPESFSGSSVKRRMNNSAKEVIEKYLKKVKPLYENLSRQRMRTERSTKKTEGVISQSFLGNLRYPLQSYVFSCPSSMRSSPRHSGVLSRRGFAGAGEICYGETSSMEELQSAIQGAITHCKNSLIQNKSTVFSNEI